MIQTLAAVLPFGMMFLMLTLGMRLDLAQVLVGLRAPGPLVLGLVVQLLGLPLLALAIGRLAGLEPGLQAGLMLVAASPGGITSNYIAYLARADLALSVTMTLITSLAVALSLPLVLALAGVALPAQGGLMALGLKMALVAAVPLALGAALRAGAPGLAARLLRGAEPLAKGIFALLVLATFVQNAGPMAAHFAVLGPAVLALNLGALALGRGLPAVLGVAPAAARAIMVEAGLQNVAVTIFVATSLLGQPELAVPGLIYAVMMNLSAVALILSAGSRRRARGGAA